MEAPTDEQLMGRFCDGDERAFDVLFDRHAPRVQAYLRRVVRDATLAEDLLQATFVSIVRSRDRYQRGSPLRPWLFAVAANAARDALRRQNRAGEQVDVDAQNEPAAAVVTSDPVLARRLEAALAALPLAQREAVVLHRQLEWTFEEIAAALGTNPSTVRVRAHRGEARLRELLGDVEWP